MTAALPSHRLIGSGPPLALANGGMMTFASWEPVAARLAARYRTLLFDFRGQLLSPDAPPADLAGHAADLAALLDATASAPAHVVGTSFGALVALELAASSPERVRSLVLITVAPHATARFQRQSEEMRALLAEVLAGGDRERFYDGMIAGVYSEAYRAREAAAIAQRRALLHHLPLGWFVGVEKLLAVLDGYDLDDRLAAVRCPVLVVAAAQDQVMDLADSRRLAAALGADLLVHPTAGHGLVAEDPEWLADACLAFLDRLGREA
jgi:aminoacrylate hydrolase